ncbi:cation-transporting P-type ATPase, partial [Lacrimispora sp.]|uniref:P-type ATPase n=1 Tax=Lacrimispora sp. TaxID=2719234 RepID=UPI0032E47B32
MTNDAQNTGWRGLTDDEVNERLEQGLVNQTDISTGKSVKNIILSNILTYFNLIFLIIAILLIYVGSYRNLTFLPVIIGNIVIGIVQELRAKQILDKMNLINAPHSIVFRNGVQKQILSQQLVKDDIVLLSAGNQICADAIVIEGSIQVNEALLTGEADEIEKISGSSLLSGSFVVSGQCYAKLEHVGNDSYITKLTAEAKAMGSGEQSEMIRSINQLVKWIGIG